jgi:hypothetical protein
VQANRLISGNGKFSEQFGELARGTAALQIHLEKAVLGVREPKREGDVCARLALNVHQPTGIALDFDRRLYTFQAERAVQSRQATSQPAEAEHGA